VRVVTETLQQRLEDACRAKGFKPGGGPDEAVSSPPYEKWWGCVYDPASGEVAALVTDAPLRTVKKRLLADMESAPPVVARGREGTVSRVDLGPKGRPEPGRFQGQVDVEFTDGSRESFVHPWLLPVRVGWPVREFEFEGHDGPVILWGPEHIPRRLTDRPLGGY
jgi:hypothetical protein